MLWNNIKGFQGQRLGLHFNMFDNKTNEAFIDSKTHAKCGKCGFTNSIKHNFIHHLVKKCKCPSYELNSHRLVYRRQLINWYEFKECLRDAFYCL